MKAKWKYSEMGRRQCLSNISEQSGMKTLTGFILRMNFLKRFAEVKDFIDLLRRPSDSLGFSLALITILTILVEWKLPESDLGSQDILTPSSKVLNFLVDHPNEELVASVHALASHSDGVIVLEWWGLGELFQFRGRDVRASASIFIPDVLEIIAMLWLNSGEDSSCLSRDTHVGQGALPTQAIPFLRQFHRVSSLALPAGIRDPRVCIVKSASTVV